jgi:hypothetical protein
MLTVGATVSQTVHVANHCAGCTMRDQGQVLNATGRDHIYLLSSHFRARNPSARFADHFFIDG